MAFQLSDIPLYVLKETHEKWKNNLDTGIVHWDKCGMCYYLRQRGISGEVCDIHCPLALNRHRNYALCKGFKTDSILHPDCHYYWSMSVDDAKEEWRRIIKVFLTWLQKEINRKYISEYSKLMASKSRHNRMMRGIDNLWKQ